MRLRGFVELNAEWIARRLKSNWGLKVALSLGLTVGFCACYLLLQRYPQFAVTEMRTTRLDRMIPFVPGAVYLYESLWLLLPLAPWLMDSKQDLVRYSSSLILISLIGFAIFFFFPTSSPRPTNIHDTNTMYMTLVSVENELNAFPSLHVALAFLSAACFRDIILSGRWRNWICLFVWTWVAAVIISTLLTKQHVLADVVVGFILGGFGYSAFYRRRVALE